jgi:hypothetical protein
MLMGQLFVSALNAAQFFSQSSACFQPASQMPKALKANTLSGLRMANHSTASCINAPCISTSTSALIQMLRLNRLKPLSRIREVFSRERIVTTSFVRKRELLHTKSNCLRRAHVLDAISKEVS